MIRKVLRVPALATSLLLSAWITTAMAAPEGAPEPPPRGTEFVAVEGGTEMVSGGTLLVEAYVALWVILLAFVLISWRRQGRIDARVADLERALGRGAVK